MEGFESNGSDASNIPKDRIRVEGYDTSIYEYDLELALTKHFSSCGEISHIYIPRNFEKGILKSFAFVDFATEGAVEKALNLSRSAVEGGWRVFAEESPFNGDYIDPGWADVSFKHFSSERTKAIISIREEGAAEKALELSGRDMGGWNITVECVMPPMDSEKNFPTSNRAPPSILGIMKKMKKKMKKKMNKKTTD
ncbi:predicted protein [Arabidopsis lyrata subsp. lyrata]|uniref:Predicted protein n=1 Tax=Arabidopsis lyrata subsp. lyrata TaxID=81972 RepID=D7KZF2_ARALL|nr:predicted protein [Arabidopsis lyrata subsp. lyrata]